VCYQANQLVSKESGQKILVSQFNDKKVQDIDWDMTESGDFTDVLDRIVVVSGKN
jgi:hypothetical protein